MVELGLLELPDYPEGSVPAQTADILSNADAPSAHHMYFSRINERGSWVLAMLWQLIQYDG